MRGTCHHGFLDQMDRAGIEPAFLLALEEKLTVVSKPQWLLKLRSLTVYLSHQIELLFFLRVTVHAADPVSVKCFFRVAPAFPSHQTQVDGSPIRFRSRPQ